MRTSKIVIKNLFGISERVLNGNSVEITGVKGVGKTSIIDAIRYALTNNSERDYIVKNGENEGEILIETDTGLSINRKKRTTQSDYKSIRENGKDVQRPESFLSEIFTPLSINPVEFTQLPRQEQNRIILDLIDFKWDLNWIREQFGELPAGINFEQNILKVLADIQAENGAYFMTRQDINRDIRNKQAFVYDIAKDIPAGYDFSHWNGYELGPKYRELEGNKAYNGQIQRAKEFKDSYDNKARGIESKKLISISASEKTIQGEKENLLASIERMKAEIIAANERIRTMANTLDDKRALAEAEYETKMAKLNADIGVADEYANKDPKDITNLNDEIITAEAMKKHLNEYKRMTDMQKELEALNESSECLTVKIELARELPSQILKEATLPIPGLSVKDGIPLINDLPVSNLSDGEKLDLCVDITISKPSLLNMILLDGMEKMDDVSRERLYAKCKARGLQFISTRTDNANELTVTEL